MSNSITFTRGDAIVSVDVAGHTLRLQQSSTPVLGTTVWDSSIVQLQYLAATKACRQALAGKHVVELGSGCGLGGLGAAVLGAGRVTLTDKDEADVIANLRRNVAANSLTVAEARATAHPAPQLAVAELDWQQAEAHVAAAGLAGSADVVIGSDLVYSCGAVAPLVRSLSLLCHSTTVLYITNEDRSVQATQLFLDSLKALFVVKRVPQSKLPPEARNPSLYTLQLKPRREAFQAAGLWSATGKLAAGGLETANEGGDGRDDGSSPSDGSRAETDIVANSVGEKRSGGDDGDGDGDGDGEGLEGNR